MGMYSNLTDNQVENDLLIAMVKNLERTRAYYSGYAYVRTIRNILIGKEDAAIAPLFKDEPYYGLFYKLSMDQVECMMDALVRADRLKIIYTHRGKLYCTPDYYGMVA